MAGDWIKMRIDLQTHPKVFRIVSALKADRLRVIGGLHIAWSIFDTHCDDGVLVGYTPEAMDAVIGWPGFTQAMIDVEWASINEAGSLVMPRFQEHNGASAKRRANDNERKRASRKETGVHKMSASDADDTRTREEKRREDQHNTQGAGAENLPAPKAASEMTLEWTPDERLLAAYSKRMGVPINLFTHEAIGAFVCHYSASGRFEAMQAWVSLLVKWIKRDMATGAAASNVKPFPVRQASGPDFNDTTWADDLGAL